MRSFVAQLAQIFFGGLAAGWLTGLSATPVVAGVLSSVLTALVAYVALNPGNDRRRPGSAVALLTGVAIGAAIGVHARTHDWLGESPDNIVSRWSKKTGLDERTLYRRMFDLRYPMDPALRQSADRGVLFTNSVSLSECDRLRPLRGAELRNHVASVSSQRFAALADQLDPQNLEIVVKAVCPD
jgi:hypothetical protein